MQGKKERHCTMTTTKGIPLKDRTTADIKEVLSNLDEETLKPYLQLHEYAKKEHLGISSLERQTGISSTALSQAFNGKYEGDYVEIAARIKTFFWWLEQKALYGAIHEFKETALASTLWQVFDVTRVIRRIQIVQGPELVGKTRAAEEYAARNNSGRTIYVQLSGGSKSGAGDFIWLLAEKFGLPYTIKLKEKRLRIREALTACDLIIIDEAHIIFSWTDKEQALFWDYLRTDIFNNGERGIILMATNSDMLSGIHAWKGRIRYNIGQLLGRMRVDPMVIDPAEGDIIPEDIALLVSRYYKPGKAMLNKLHDLACREQLGHLGLLDDIMTKAWSRAKGRKKQLDDETVQSVLDKTLEVLNQRKDIYK